MSGGQGTTPIPMGSPAALALSTMGVHRGALGSAPRPSLSQLLTVFAFKEPPPFSSLVRVPAPLKAVRTSLAPGAPCTIPPGFLSRCPVLVSEHACCWWLRVTVNEAPYQCCLSQTVWMAAGFLAQDLVVENDKRILGEQHVLGKQGR